MMPAAKHGDVQMGVDIHLCTVPTPAPTPLPLPTPHMSVVFDPFDYVPVIGATVTVCGMKRATAGTAGKVVHIPPGFPFAPKLPDNEDELFMGSATVVADGDPMSHIAHPVLACQAAGMMSPFRLKKKGGPRAMVLPTVFNLATPTTVFVGGPPTISLMGMAMKGVFAGLGKLAKSGVFKRMRQKLFKNMKPGFLKCTVLRAEPVNILNGAVSVEQTDFELPGRLPLEWRRSYDSAAAAQAGVCGPGWQTLLDIRLEVDPADGGVTLQGPGLGPLLFAQLPAVPGDAGRVLERTDGARLSDDGDAWQVRTKDDRRYRFPKAMATRRADGHGVVPIGRLADGCGNGWDVEYRGGRPAALVDEAGRRLALTMAEGRLVAVTLVDTATCTDHGFVRYEYDAAGDLVAVVDALGAPYRFAYGQGATAHHLLRHTDRVGLSFHYAYEAAPDGTQRVVHGWGDGGLYDYRFEYLDTLAQRRITDSLGHVSLVQLDDRGLPINEIDPLGGMTVYEYDDAGRTTAVVDPAGRRTGYVHDERGNLLQLQRADGSVLATVFDDDDQPVVVTDAMGQAWRQRFDARGRLVAQCSPLGHVSRYAYDGLGQLVACTDPRGARTTLRYDAAGRLAGLTDALGHTTEFAHDLLGRLVARRDALGRCTRYRHDAKGRLLAVQAPSGSVVEFGYDAEDRLVRHVDEQGGVTELAYVGLGELARRVQPDGRQVTYQYDTEERLVGVCNQRGEVHRLLRDALGRVVEEVDYWGQSRRQAYDAGGHLLWSQDPLHRRIVVDCDPLGRVVRRRLADPFGGEAPFVETFAYDANGNLVETANPHVRVSRRFDAEGRLLEERQAHAAGPCFVVRNTYDAAGHRVHRVTEDGQGPARVVEYACDLLDRPVGMRIDGGPPMRLQHDAVGRVSVEELAPGLERRFRYDDDDLVAEQLLARDGQPLFATRYQHDRVGRLTQRLDSRLGSDRYVYDPLGRIVEHTDPQGRLERFGHDPAGDRLSTRVAEGPGERWQRDGEYRGTAYRFDRAGNLTQRADRDTRLDLAWDAHQRLVASRRETRAGRRLTTYGYDPLGRRLFKETDGVRTWFGWDGDALAQATEGGRTRTFVHGAGSYAPRVVIDADGAWQHCACEPNGAVSRLFDGEGRVLWEDRAGGAAAPGEGFELALPNQYVDRETGLRYNRNRYFIPELEQFASADPLGLRAGPNTYWFAPNTVGYSDPLGLDCTFRMQPYRYSDVRVKGPHGDVLSRSGHKVTEGRLVISGDKLAWLRFGDMGKATSKELKEADRLLAGLVSDPAVMRAAEGQVDQVIVDLTRDLTHKNKATRELAARQLDYFTRMKGLF